MQVSSKSKICKFSQRLEIFSNLFKTILCLDHISVQNKLTYQAACFGTVVTMSALAVFGRKMIFIGHKLGQLVIIDLLCF